MTAYRLILTGFLLLGLTAGAAESYIVVKTVDTAGATELSVMTPAELKSLESAIQVDTRLHPKALAMAKAEWAKDADNKRAFPVHAINRRTVAPVSPVYRDRDAADEKLGRLQDRMLEREDTERKKKQSQHRQNSSKGQAQSTREKASELEREAMEEKARELYETQLEKLRTKPQDVKDAPPPASAPKPAPAAGGHAEPKPQADAGEGM